MKKWLFVVVLGLGVGVGVALAQSVILTTTDALAFDYLDTDYSASRITRFEASWDGADFAVVSTVAGRDAETWPGHTSYKVSPPFTSGTHTVAFRACNAAGCGGASAPFAFGYLASPASSPTHVRKVTQ